MAPTTSTAPADAFLNGSTYSASPRSRAIRATSRRPKRPRAIASPPATVSAASSWPRSTTWVQTRTTARSKSASSSALTRNRSRSRPRGAAPAVAPATSVQSARRLVRKAKDSVDLSVTVNVPGGRQCELINRAATVFPVPGTRYNNVIGDDVAAATSPHPRQDLREAPSDRSASQARTSCAAAAAPASAKPASSAMARRLASASSPSPSYARRQAGCPATAAAPRQQPQCEPGPGEYRNDDGRCVCKRGWSVKADMDAVSRSRRRM